jgi:hypothetical protein
VNVVLVNLRNAQPALASLLILFIGMMIVAACTNNRPAATAIPPTASPTLGEQTLPPTWTPTGTFTPAPTRTPSLTPTIPPTLSLADLCANFKLLAAPENNVKVEYNAAVVFAWKGVPTGGIPAVLNITLHHSKAGVRADIPQPGDGLVQIPMRVLPQEGIYEWEIWLQHPVFGKICSHSGSFLRISPVF